MDRPAGANFVSEEGRRLAGTLSDVANGDTAAMARLYERTSGKLFGICLRILGSEAEAEEALQETFVTVWRKAAAFDQGKASAVTWLAVLARNKAIDRLRGRRPGTDAGLDAAADIADSGASALDLLEDAQESRRLSACLDELEPRTGEAIRAAFIGGASYPDLAAREGVPLGTMKSWVRRGLLRLRGCLER
ncbi:MAG TPA: sigma-70 family RNA polymerase sigma factor [Allosphingosinicella sp.]|nr:sigma-70 family RNA polymerase sigma factor [Allosphingosinicella sp.]